MQATETVHHLLRLPVTVLNFRAVGSGQSVAGPLVSMNTMLADSLNWVADSLEAHLAKGSDLDTAILATLKEIIDTHGAVVFGGNGYSAEMAQNGG